MSGNCLAQAYVIVPMLLTIGLNGLFTLCTSGKQYNVGGASVVGYNLRYFSLLMPLLSLGLEEHTLILSFTWALDLCNQIFVSCSVF